MFIRYNRYLLALDIFGLISLVAVVFYLITPDGSRLPASQDGMIANVLSELVGIWISVRLISFFILQNERRDRARVRTVRNMRMIERMAVNVLLFKTGVEVVNLRRELEWVRSIRPQRERFLSKDEVMDVNAFYEAIDKFCALISAFKAVLHRKPIELDEEQAPVAVFEIEAMRHAAERNILEETEEDTGF